MTLKGIALSAASENDRSAYSYRILKLAECLNKRSIECDFFFMPDHPPLDTETTASLFMPFWIRKIRNYNFIYCGGEEAAQALFFCRLFLKGRIIVDIHGDLLAQSSLANETGPRGKRAPSLRVKMIHKMGMACADHLLTVCEPQKEAFVRSGISPEKISLIRNGVDLALFRPLPQPKSPEFTFAYAGEFQVWQGIYNLIRAYERLNNPNVRMLVVGFRSEDKEIKQNFFTRFGERVKLVDRTDRESMIQLLRSVSILIIPRISHPAIQHAFPTKFAEYAALGRPIIVNDVDETADFVKSYKCGFVSDPSPENMAETMTQAAQTPYEALAEMGRRSRQMAEENFSWDIIGDEYERVVRRITGQWLD